MKPSSFFFLALTGMFAYSAFTPPGEVTETARVYSSDELPPVVEIEIQNEWLVDKLDLAIDEMNTAIAEAVEDNN